MMMKRKEKITFGSLLRITRRIAYEFGTKQKIEAVRLNKPL